MDLTGSLRIFPALVVFALIDPLTAAGGDCLDGGGIECFECNTWEDERCHDPWNWTHTDLMPPLLPCNGCCVKMVSYIGTEHYQIRRTCTDKFEVNFFMVNHACMQEGHRYGHMCFCEEDQCNSSGRPPYSFLLTVLAFALTLYNIT